MTFTGFLLRLGYFEFLPLYLTLMAGDLTADVIWYAVGYHWGAPFIRRFGKFLNVTERAVAKLEEMFHKHHDKILLVSKITMGFGFATVTLFTAGLAKVPFRRYLAFNAAGQFVWTALLVFLGYAFGNLYVKINEEFRLLSFIAFSVLVIAVLYGLGRYLSTRTFRNNGTS